MEDELNAAWKAVSSDSLRLTQDSKVPSRCWCAAISRVPAASQDAALSCTAPPLQHCPADECGGVSSRAVAMQVALHNLSRAFNAHEVSQSSGGSRGSHGRFDHRRRGSVPIHRSNTRAAHSHASSWAFECCQGFVLSSLSLVLDVLVVSHTAQAACRSVDMLVKEVEGSGRAVQLENDPWVTESLLAKAHKHLRTCLEVGPLALRNS